MPVFLFLSKNMDKPEKLEALKKERDHYQEKLAQKMKGYRGVIHESAASELRHSEVEVYRAMLRSVETQIAELEGQK